MKKNFLFGLLALMLAWFWFGGISLAEDVAKIGDWECGTTWTTCYENLLDAITVWWEIEIIKAWEYTLPTTINNDTTIEKADSVEWVVTLKIDGSTIWDGGALITLWGNLTIEWATINLVNIGSNWEHLWDATHKITMEKCIINWELYIRWDMDFKECTFNWQDKYQIHINYWNVNFDTCIFTNNVSRHINIAWWWDDTYKINFKDSTFTNTVGAASKAAVMIHELWNQTQYSATNNPSYYRGISEDKLIDINGTKYIPWKWEVTFENTNVTDGSIFSDAYIWNSKLFGIDTIYSSDNNGYIAPKEPKDDAPLDGIILGSLNWGEVKVNDITHSKTYQTPSKAVAKIGEWECGTAWTTCYEDLLDAITVWWEIEIIKAWEYTLPTTIANNTTIKKANSVEWVVTLKIDGSTIWDGEALIALWGNLTIEWATINLVNVGSNWEHLGDATHKITMEKCIINWELYVRWDMDFKECTFNWQGKYQIHINYWNVNFDTCTFTNNVSRHINIAWWWDATYKINFKDSTFSNTVGAASKAAVMIHELWNQSQYSATNNPSYYRGISEDKLIDINGTKYIPWKWEVTFENTNVTDGSIFSDAYIWNSKLFGIDTIYSSDNNGYIAPKEPKDDAPLDGIILGSLNWGEVKVKLDWSQVYTTPKKGVSQWTVTFDWENALIVNDWEIAVKPTNPADQGCSKHFVEWRLNGATYDFNTPVTSHLALTSYWTSTCSSWGGGWGSSKTYSCKNLPDNAVKNNSTSPKSDTNYSYSTDTTKVCTFQCKSGYTWNSKDAKCEKSDANTNDENKVDETNNENNNNEWNNNGDNNNGWSNDGSSSTDKGFSQEFKDAYKFAHDNGITTKDSIEEADMYGPLTRIAMAKMLSQYAINVLGKTPDTSKVVPNFPDVDAQLDTDYNNWVTLAYQLGIMWIGIEEFRPFDLVTRAEFGTALSRMLYGTADGEGADWYSTHLAKLMNEKIITNDNPQLQELRGYVMIMLMRSAQ